MFDTKPDPSLLVKLNKLQCLSLFSRQHWLYSSAFHEQEGGHGEDFLLCKWLGLPWCKFFFVCLCSRQYREDQALIPMRFHFRHFSSAGNCNEEGGFIADIMACLM